jgi:AraC-like DNA-binding protein
MYRKVEIVLSLIAEDLTRTLSMEELAHAVNLSPSRLRHLFKEATGVSLTQHLKLHKMSEAKELLETSVLSIKEIMHIVSVRDRSHFSRDFKRLYGMTPKDYREQHLRVALKRRD